MALTKSFPAVSLAATQLDVRRSLEGTVARDAAGAIRAGVFPTHYDPLVTARATMGVNVADFRAVLNRGGPVFIANVGQAVVPLSAAPAANRRLDIVYARQAEVVMGDANDTIAFAVAVGTASAAANLPVPSIPAGALALASVEIPAGATTTQSAGVIITQIYPYTASAGGVVAVRDPAELATWSPTDGSQAYGIADGLTYTRYGGSWGGPGTYMINPTWRPKAGFEPLTLIRQGRTVTLQCTFENAVQVSALAANTQYELFSTSQWSPPATVIRPLQVRTLGTGSLIVASNGRITFSLDAAQGTQAIGAFYASIFAQWQIT